jgi:hypothetical protein
MLCSLVQLSTALAAEPEALHLTPAPITVNVTEPAANLRRKPDPYELDRPHRRAPLWARSWVARSQAAVESFTQ